MQTHIRMYITDHAALHCIAMTLFIVAYFLQTRAWEAAADSSGAAFTAMRGLLPSTANAFIVQVT
jgi:hypothetical protein